MSQLPKVSDAHKVLESIERQDVGPFQEILAELLACKPSLEKIREFANKSPDRWGQAITMIARLSGYHDPKILTINNYYPDIRALSDSELSQMAQEYRHTLDAEAIDVTPDE